MIGPARAARLAALCLGVACAGGVVAQGGSEAQRAAQETQAKQKLDAVRAEIGRIAQAQKEVTLRKGDAASALRDQELKVAASAKALHALDLQLADVQARLAQSRTQREALQQRLASQRETLAALLRSAYAIGRDEELKLLLGGERGAADRLLAYYRYFERARVGEIERVLGDLAALADVDKAIAAQSAELDARRAQHLAEAQQLDADRAEREKALAALDGELRDQQSRLAALGKDEAALVDLIAKLRDIFADIPRQIAGAEPFAQLRGRLAWPLRGKLASTYGAHEAGDRVSNGIVITATEGAAVRAVSHGRVVFADWMRGFGLLLIVDHGDGYLSLYGYNETLLKDVGDWVDSNEVIANAGATGGQKLPGLYFELRAQGKPVDPRAWLKP